MSAQGYAFGQKGIATFRVLPEGELKPVGAIPLQASYKPVRLWALDVAGRWLCVAPEFVPRDTGDGAPSREPKPWRKTTRLTFILLDASGMPTRRAHCTVPVIAQELVPCPTGKRLFVDGGNAISVVDIEPGSAPVVRSTLSFSRLYLFISQPGLRNDTQLSLSPDGRYVFHFIGTGFVDHSENHLDRFRVDSRGRLHPLGETIVSTSSSNRQHAGPVWLFPDGKTVVLADGILYSGLWKAGKLHALTPLDDKSSVSIVDPRGRFFVTASYYRKPYGAVYRRTAPGKLVGAGAYTELVGQLSIEPGGRFLYSQSEGKLKTWRINADCSLTYLRQQPWPQERGYLRFPAR